MLNRFQQAAMKAGQQASAFSQTVAKEVQSGGQATLGGFKLENEVRVFRPR